MALPLVFILLIVFALFVLPFLWNKPHGTEVVQSHNRRLNKICSATNVILTFLYFPLSLFGFLLGMVGEGMYDLTAMQELLCRTIGVLGLFTAVPAFGGVLMSYVLRKQERSVLSFWIQFAGMFHIALCVVLLILMDLP